MKTKTKTKTKIISLSMVAFSILLGVQATYANEIQDQSIKKKYISVSVGSSTLKPKVLTEHGSVTDKSSTALSVSAGCMIKKNVGVEVFYSDLGTAKVKLNHTKSTEVNYKAYGVNGMYKHAFTNKFSGFGKLGIARVDHGTETVSIDKVENYHFVRRVGAEFKMTKSLSIIGEYQMLSDDIKVTKVGLSWAF